MYFINYYEKNYAKAEIKFDKIYGRKKYEKWSNSWRMGWVVRNALVHNGRVFYSQAKSDTPPVSWYSTIVSPKNQGDALLGNFLNSVDLLILVLDMDSDLSN